MKHGVPFDVAHSFDDVELLAYCVGLGEIEGGTFDWDRMRWVEKDTSTA